MYQIAICYPPLTSIGLSAQPQPHCVFSCFLQPREQTMAASDDGVSGACHLTYDNRFAFNLYTEELYNMAVSVVHRYLDLAAYQGSVVVFSVTWAVVDACFPKCSASGLVSWSVEVAEEI